MDHIEFKYGESFWEGGIPLRVLRHDHRGNRTIHKHDFNELVLIVSGECVHSTPEGSYRIAPGDLFLIKPGSAHSYSSVTEFSLINILYSDALIPQWDIGNLPGYQMLFHLEPGVLHDSGLKRHLHLEPPVFERLLHRITLLEEILQSVGPGYRFHAVTCLMEIIYAIGTHFSEVAPQDPEHSELYRLGRAISYMKRHLKKKITVKELAHLCCLSETSLYRLFMEGVGIAPIHYLNDLRLQQAKHLLTHTAKPVTAIAHEVGIPDSNYFSRLFLKYTGQTPRAYRRSV